MDTHLSDQTVRLYETSLSKHIKHTEVHHRSVSHIVMSTYFYNMSKKYMLKGEPLCAKRETLCAKWENPQSTGEILCADWEHLQSKGSPMR